MGRRSFSMRGFVLLAAPVIVTATAAAAIAFKPAAPAPATTPSDPLLDTTAYSLYIHPNGRDPERYFPLGVLFPRDRGELISYGFDLTEQAVGPLLDPNGSTYMMDWYALQNSPVPPPPPSDHLSLFVASWAWHLLPRENKVGSYGPFGKDPSYFDPAVHDFLLTADRALASRYGRAAQPALMWSLDNEWEGQLDYTPTAVSGFKDYLQKTYGTLAKLNAAWGTSYADWDAIIPPQSEPQISRPAAWLDWHAYQDGFFTRMTADRYRTLFENDPFHRPVAYKSTQQSFDLQTVGKKRVLDPALLCELTRPFGGWYGSDIYGMDDSLSYEVNFAAQCIRPLEDSAQGKLFLTEINNHGGPGWQWSNSLWRTLANGGKAYNLFCFGMPAATSDSDIYGMTAPDGTLRSKAPYAARFAYAVRRTEAFWERSKPAPKVRRVALLLNRPDVLLADDIPNQMWSGPTNSRTAIYKTLREAGYWVDVLPYTKLNAKYLARYDTLLLVGSDHIAPGACREIEKYVCGGGVLVADRLAGFYDTRHQEIRGLEPVLGVHVASAKPEGGFTLTTASGKLTGTGSVRIQTTTAQIMEKTAEGSPAVCRNAVGKGHALWIDTEMGALKGSAPETLRGWLTELLRKEGVEPAYAATNGSSEATASLRVEQPWMANGNIALIVASVAEKGHGFPVTVDIDLPPGSTNRGKAYWSPAESAALTPVAASRGKGGRTRFTLPTFATAGTLLLLPDHSPLIAVAEIKTAKRGIDGHLPVLTAGKPVTVTATVVNPASVAAPAGRLRVRALAGWKVSPGAFPTPRLAPHGEYRVTFTVTPPASGVLPYNERMYPINLRWSDGKQDRAVTTTPVGVDIPLDRCPFLLTENATYPESFQRRLKTGATYRYPDADRSDTTVADPGAEGGSTKPNTALQDGSSRWMMASESARFHLPSAQDSGIIEYNLKAEYRLHAVRVLSSGPGGFPTHVDVSVSSDGVHFTPAGSAEPIGGPGSAKWIEVRAVEGKSARYVRIGVRLQGGDGYVNEIEVWGYR